MTREEVLRERRRPITTDCCDGARRFGPIVLGHNYESYCEAESSDDWLPEWRLQLNNDVMSRNYELTGVMEHPPPPTHCPYCGARVPELRKKKTAPKPLCRTTDNNYCDTCDERLMSCTCWPPQAAWEIEKNG